MEQFTDENKITEETTGIQDPPDLSGKIAETALEKSNENNPQEEVEPVNSSEPSSEVESPESSENTEPQAQASSKEAIIAIEPVEHETGTFSSFASSLQSDLKSQIEAVLFVTEHPLKTGAIAKLLNTSYDDVQAAIVQLIQEYEDKNGGLEIGSEDGYIIQVKIQYLNIVTEMMPLELNTGPLRTLSIIALKEPVLQSIIVDMRGSSAYEHINELVEMDLVTKKPQGLSYVLRTTKKFNQYFRLTQEASKVKDKLQEQATRLAKERKKQLEEEAALKEAQEQAASTET